MASITTRTGVVTPLFSVSGMVALSSYAGKPSSRHCDVSWPLGSLGKLCENPFAEMAAALVALQLSQKNL